MKTVTVSLTLLVLLLTQSEILACEVCVKRQPKILQGITHGAGPQSDWDYVTVACMATIVAISLFFCIKWMLCPGENEREHIKNSILNAD